MTIVLRFTLNLLICAAVSFVFWYIRPLIHELGHVIALIITKLILHNEYTEILDIKVSVTFREGRTASKLLAYLAYANDLHKDFKTGLLDSFVEPKLCKRKICIEIDKLILVFYFWPVDLTIDKYTAKPDVTSSKYNYLLRFNHIAGILLEVVLIPVLFNCCRYAFTSFTNLTYAFYINTGFWFIEIIAILVFRTQPDLKYFIYPNLFSTKNTTSKFEQPFSKTNRLDNAGLLLLYTAISLGMSMCFSDLIAFLMLCVTTIR